MDGAPEGQTQHQLLEPSPFPCAPPVYGAEKSDHEPFLAEKRPHDERLLAAILIQDSGRDSTEPQLCKDRRLRLRRHRSCRETHSSNTDRRATAKNNGHTRTAKRHQRSERQQMPLLNMRCSLSLELQRRLVSAREGLEGRGQLASGPEEDEAI